MQQVEDRVVPWGAGRDDVEGPPIGTNRWALWAAVCGAFGLAPLGLILGITGWLQTRRSGQQGRGLAVTGVVLSVLWVAAVTSVVLSPSIGIDRGANGAVSTAQYAGIFDVHVGDCFNWAPPASDGSVQMVKLVPCGQPHQGQVYATPNVPPVADDQVEAAAKDACERAAAAHGVPEAAHRSFMYPEHVSLLAKESQRVICHTTP